MAKVMVIGGTGQISAQVTAQLVRLGHQVVTLNRGRFRLPVPDGVTNVAVDRTNAEAFAKAVESVLASGVDTVIHEEALHMAISYLEANGLFRSSDESDRDDKVIAAVQAGHGDWGARIAATKTQRAG